MSEGFPLTGCEVLRVRASDRVESVMDVLCDIATMHYSFAEVYGGKEDDVNIDVKKVLQHADRHGIDIVDRTPRGSKLKRYLSWELRPIAQPLFV